jgi:hypothetical protein
MSVYRLTLTSDRYSENEGRPYKPELIEFKDKEELDAYKEGEYRYCMKEYKNYARAWSKEEREEKFAKLVAMRKSFKNKWLKQQDNVEKELA